MIKTAAGLPLGAPGGMVSGMRGALILLLGVTSGIVGAVLIFTLTDTFDPEGPDDSGGGNARVEIHEDALGTAMEARLVAAMEEDLPMVLQVAIQDTGMLDIEILVGDLSLGATSVIQIDPEVVDGELLYEVIESELYGLPTEAEVAALLMAPLYTALEGLAGGLPYRLVSITTRNGKLTLDIEL